MLVLISVFGISQVKENGGLLPDICNFYKDTHQNKKTKEWSDPICCDLHVTIPIIWTLIVTTVFDLY